MSQILSESLSLPCGAVIPNRIGKAAMTEGLATAQGMPTPELERLYGLWSDGGAGLLLTGNIQVDADHLERPGNVVIDREPDAAMRSALRQPSLGANQPRRTPDAEKCQSAPQGALGREAGIARRAIR